MKNVEVNYSIYGGDIVSVVRVHYNITRKEIKIDYGVNDLIIESNQIP